MSVVAPVCLLLLCLVNLQYIVGAKGHLRGNLRDRLVAAGIQGKSARRQTHSLERSAKRACRSRVILSGRSGKIISPGYTRRASYPKKVNCAWIIRSPPNKIVRIVVLFADIRCPDGLEIFNYAGRGHAGYHLATVCGRKRRNKIRNDNTAIYTDSNGAYVTFRTFPGRKRGAGFILRYTLVDPEDRPCGIPRIEPFVPGMSGNNGGGGILPPGTLPLTPGQLPLLPPDVRIIGGFETVPFSWPWHVAVNFMGFNFCGGTLINKRWIVTAAHCVGSPWGPEDMTVIAGMFNTSKSDAEEPSRQTVKVINWYIHKDYDTAIYKNDIALAHLAEDMRFSPQVSPVCLPKRAVKANKMCVITGWGKTAVKWPDVLHQVNIPIVDQKVCRQPTWHGNNITDDMLCAGYPEGGKDTCSSDSGGPLVCKYGQNWVLHGVTSWGKGYECGAPKNPGVYTRISRYIKWMKKIMSSV